MERSARMSSKGQITVPRSVRQALQLREGDSVVFRVDGERALMAKTKDFLALAGTVPVPAAVRGLPWSEVVARSRMLRAARLVADAPTDTIPPSEDEPGERRK